MTIDRAVEIATFAAIAAAEWRNHVLNTLYFIAATCVAYKLAFLIRQVADVMTPSMLVFRWAAFAVAGMVMFKATSRVLPGGDPATVLDILRELSWCAVLAALIFHMKNFTGRY